MKWLRISNLDFHGVTYYPKLIPKLLLDSSSSRSSRISRQRHCVVGPMDVACHSLVRASNLWTPVFLSVCVLPISYEETTD